MTTANNQPAVKRTMISKDHEDMQNNEKKSKMEGEWGENFMGEGLMSQLSLDDHGHAAANHNINSSVMKDDNAPFPSVRVPVATLSENELSASTTHSSLSEDAIGGVTMMDDEAAAYKNIGNAAAAASPAKGMTRQVSNDAINYH
eukprot:CAMPEP_0172322862 /NCGR_PEP_ID=MMETSP1058-20130122/47121_1 /TAXON_ID=83371 /ORGANISM="Detonula confervacea, Strain CCMP 353" /LENGTH=144 /DNA_ID=CAMNT_0013038721 /DNA_START=15 /DNA_END=446 /DNA_ORIENTATION=+